MELLFDLDGTLTDPFLGISRCIQYALRTMGQRTPGKEDLKPFVGPPLRVTFAELLSTDDESMINEAIRRYRDRFEQVGMFENEVCPGVREGLSTLRSNGHMMRVVTSKPQVYARQIIDHFALGGWFEEVYGSELSGRNANKTDLIKMVLGEQSLDHATTWMIGDRAQDVIGGRANAIGTIAVLWGYGTREELSGAEPDALVATMSELCGFLHCLTPAAADERRPPAPGR